MPRHNSDGAPRTAGAVKPAPPPSKRRRGGPVSGLAAAGGFLAFGRVVGAVGGAGVPDSLVEVCRVAAWAVDGFLLGCEL